MTGPGAMAHFDGELIGEHPSMQELRRLIGRIAASPTRTVMLYGETGTGKSLVSRLLHRLSPRASGRFVDVNCAAIPPNLIESELFGHEKGAFTGAVGRKQGLLEAAHKGTLFLDEISELDLVLQAKLLGFLDSQEFRRVGGIDTTAVDVRFVAATNRMLMPEVLKGKFREDLFYRLQLVFVTIPPLRERGDDVFLLTEHHLAELSRRYRRRVTGMDARVREIFRGYHWPGNVRELAHLLERILILSDDTVIREAHLPPRMTDPNYWRKLEERGEVTQRRAPAPVEALVEAERLDLERATADFQRRLIEAMLARCQGQLGRTAAALGLSRHALRHRMIRLGLRDPDPEGARRTH